MEYLTPTGWAKSGGGTPVKQYGRLRLLIPDLPAGSVVIIAHLERAARVGDILAEMGRPRTDIRTLPAAGGCTMLYELPRQTPLGIDHNAFSSLPREVWADVHKLLTTRFETVLWV